MFYTVRPSEAEVEKVMRETGMDRVQAYNHVKCRIIMRERMAATAGLRR